MGLFDRFRKKEPPKMMVRKYAGAAGGRLFNDFQTASTSADSELETAIVSLRDRSRDLARNDPFVKRYFTLLRNNVVGDQGVTLQVKAQENGVIDMRGNQTIEDAFKVWCKRGNCTVDGRMSFVDCQKLVVEALHRDGEVFILKHFGKGFTHNFSIQFIEPDQIDETYNKTLPNGGSIRMGVERDQYHRPIAYYVKKDHPGDSRHASMSEKKRERIEAKNVIHIYNANRAGQTRGEPVLAPVITTIKQLNGLVEAQLVACRTGASKMGFFTSPAGDGFAADDFEDSVPIYEVSPGTMHQLPTGVDFKSFDPQYPNEFASFHKSIMRAIAAAMGVSYNTLANDLESTSYSSVRQGALDERDNYKNIQQFLIDHFVRPVYEAWLEKLLGYNHVFLPLAKFDKFADAATFRGRTWSWIDPVKEISANVQALKAGVVSLQDVATYYGKDAEELLSQIAKDKELMSQYGVDYALEPYNAPMAAVTPDGENVV